MTASAAISAFGTLMQIGDGVAAPDTGWLSIAEVYSIGASLEGTMIDVTHLLSPEQWKEFIAGNKEAQITLGLNLLTSDDSQNEVRDALIEEDSADAVRDYRLLWPDYGSASFTATVVSATDIWTTATDHGWETGQRVKLTSSGAVPTTTPAGAIVNGGFAYVGRVDDNELKLYPTSADAIADTNAINFTNTGSGTHTLSSGSWWQFVGLVSGHTPEFANNDRVKAQVVIQVTGVIEFFPE